jgi:hypothetical protein
MSSALIRQDLVPIISGYLILMVALASGLWLSRRFARSGQAVKPAGQPATGPRPWQRPGWPRLTAHLAGTFLGGYLVLMAIVFLYYYGVARVKGSFLDSAVTGCLLLMGLALPLFLAASWATQHWSRDARRRRHQ